MKNKANIIAVMGATGSGKSTFVKQLIAEARRLLVWDAMSEYSQGEVVSSMSALHVALSNAGRTKPFRIVFRPTFDDTIRQRQFEVFCSLAHAVGSLTLVVEELRFVTTPSRAPAAWAKVTMTGRHKGLRVIGISQRPASIDKDFLGNATLIRTGRLVYPEDVRAVAKAMRITENDIQALQPLDWIEKDMQTGKKLSGRLSFQ